MIKTGLQLHAARALADLTQGQLAAACGLNPSTISALEKKRHGSLDGSSVSTLKRIEEVLNAHGVVLTEGQFGTGAARHSDMKG